MIIEAIPVILIFLITNPWDQIRSITVAIKTMKSMRREKQGMRPMMSVPEDPGPAR